VGRVDELRATLARMAARQVEVHVGTESDGAGASCRVLTIQLYQGWSVRVLLDRGADLGSAWYQGIPIAWTSPIGERPPLANPMGLDWLSAFGGGLVTTCGLRNVGAPSEGHGLHGRYSHERARLIEVEPREASIDKVTVKTSVDEHGGPGSHLNLVRTLEAWAGEGRLELTDVTTNCGVIDEPAPLLYHVNLGYPLVSEAAEIIVGDATRVQRAPIPRDAASKAQLDQARRPGPPEPSVPEAVFEHTIEPTDGGWASAEVVNPNSRLRFRLSWDASTLPRLHQWVMRSGGWYVVALEPANCSVRGRAHDLAAGDLPILPPGATRRTHLRLEIERV